MVKLIVGLRGILRTFLIGIVIGAIIEYFAWGRWLEFLVWTPVWIIPMWGFMIPVCAVGTWLLLFAGGHHE